jgi:hypothetical protein
MFLYSVYFFAGKPGTVGEGLKRSKGREIGPLRGPATAPCRSHNLTISARADLEELGFLDGITHWL